MDLQIHEAVLAAGDKESGCSVHVVNEQVDEGPILIQKRCPVLPTDSPVELKARVQALESTAFLELLRDPKQFLPL